MIFYNKMLDKTMQILDRAPNAIVISYGSLTCPSYTDTDRRGSRGGGAGDVRTPLPWNFQNIHVHLREQHFQCYQGYFCMRISKISGSLRSPVMISVYVCSVTTVQRSCRLPWKFQGCASFIYFLHLCRTT